MPGATDRRTAIHQIYGRPARNTVDVLLYHKYKIACVHAMKEYKCEQSPWEANSSSVGHEIPSILRNPKVHYSIHKRPAPVPILSQINPAHASLPHFLKIHFNIILSPIPVFQVVSFPQVSPQKPCCASPTPHTCHMIRPSHSSLLDHPNNIWWGVKCEAIPVQAWRGLRLPGGEVPGFHDNWHIKVVRFSALDKDRLAPRKYHWYSFLLEDELIPGPSWSRKNELQWYHRK